MNLRLEVGRLGRAALLLALSLAGVALAAQTAGQAPAASGSAAPAGAGGAAPTASAASPAEGKATSQQAGAGASQAPKITKVLVGSATEFGAEGQPVHLGDWLTIEIDNLEKLEKAQTKTNPLQLFLNGMPLAGVKPVALAPEPGVAGARLRFPVIRTDDPDSKNTWSALLEKPIAEQREVEVSVGIAGCAEGCTNTTDAFPIKIVVLRRGWLAGFALIAIAFAWIVVRLAIKTPLLRGRGLDSPWSLGRTQMAWWTFWVIGAFVFIWMVTGSYSSLTNSVLVLLGISTGTGFLGAVIDDNKEGQSAQRPTLEAEHDQMQAATKALAPDDPAVQANNQRLRELASQLAKMPALKKGETFVRDILSDENGVSLHRLQNVAWTLVLTTVFLVRVYMRLAMPDFDAQLLGLMGISSGTYLGFKFPEKKA